MGPKVSKIIPPAPRPKPPKISLAIRLYPEDFLKLRKAATRAKMTVSNYVRQSVGLPVINRKPEGWV